MEGIEITLDGISKFFFAKFEKEYPTNFLTAWKNHQYRIHKKRQNLPHFLFVVITKAHIKQAWELSNSSESYDEYGKHWFDPVDVALFHLLGDFKLSSHNVGYNLPKKAHDLIDTYDRCTTLKEVKNLEPISFVLELTLGDIDKRDFSEYFKTI